jgi:hypothetical protein
LLQVLLQAVEVVEAAVLGHPRILVTRNFLHHSELVLPPRGFLRFLRSRGEVVEEVNYRVQVECCIG